MKKIGKFYCRFYQQIMRMVMPFLPYRKPRLLNDAEDVSKLFVSCKVRKILLVCSKAVRDNGLTKDLEENLNKNHVDFVVFDEVISNPTISNIEAGLKVYNNNNCDAVVAVGGGSVIDCAKLIGARAVKSNMQIPQMKGLLKIKKKLPLLVAVPTTAGTGSEVTVASVVSDEKTQTKYAVNDFCLIPSHALLDYKMTITLPKFLTATTGMDALTHAVEAYIGQSSTRQTRRYSEHAVKLIFNNLKPAFDNGKNAEARQNMLIASFEAGLAFTKSYVGYVHAVAHSLGGKYGVAHGLANAVILPYFLKEYGTSIEKKLARLAKIAGVAEIGDNNKTATEKFINEIERLNCHFGIPKTLDMIKKEDIDELASHAELEANPLYPVPKLMDKNELSQMYYKIGVIEM